MRKWLGGFPAWALFLAVPVLWWIGVSWVVPRIIRATHAGSIPVLSGLMSARASQPVEGYLAAWEPLGRGLVVVGWTAAVLLLGAYLLHREVRGQPQAGMTAPARGTPRQFILVAAAMGLLTGLGEAWYYVSRVFYQGHEAAGVVGVSQHAVWMAPLANLAVFLVAGVVLLVARHASAGRLDFRHGTIALAWLGCFALVMTTGRIAAAAAAVLTLGIATQVGRVVLPGGGNMMPLAGRGVAWLGVTVVSLGLLVPVVEVLRERRQLAIADAPATDGPNILFIILDTERAASTSLHGASRPTTPFLDRLAREGAWFERAIAPSSWTLPSHAAMFTGRPTTDLGVDWNTPLDERHEVIAEVLSRQGYATAGFVANPKYLADVFGLGRGFGVWRDQPLLPGTVILHSWIARTLVQPARRWAGNYQLLGRKSADRVNAEFLGWLDGRPERSFFAFLNYYDPHMPYLPPEPWNLHFAEGRQPLYWVDGQRPDSTYTEAEKAELLAAYESSIAYLDNRLEALFGELGERDLLENTVVIITSDHGEEFGEHGTFEHGFHMTLPATHVPLIVRYPREVPAEVRVAQPVELRDLAATVLRLTGAPASGIPGESLERYWRGDDQAPRTSPAVVSTDGVMTSMVSDSFQLLRQRGREDRLYNHRRDPLGLHDLAIDPAHVGILRSLQETLTARIEARP